MSQSDSAPRPLSAERIRRLGFIRYLYAVGVEQSRKPEPLATASLLTLHDCIEMLLQLAAEHLDADTKANTEFMAYFALIDPKLPTGALSQREALRRLNKARVGLKHYGLLPSKEDIDNFRTTASSFIEDTVPLVFGVPLGSLSLATLIVDERTRKAVETAETLRDAGKADEALEELAIAFAYLMRAYGPGDPGRLGGRAFSFWPMHGDESTKALGRALEQVSRQLVRVEAEVVLLRHSIDPLRYTRFRGLTPHVTFMGDGSISTSTAAGVTHTLEDVEFCRDFVIEVAIQLQAHQPVPVPMPDTGGVLVKRQGAR